MLLSRVQVFVVCIVCACAVSHKKRRSTRSTGEVGEEGPPRWADGMLFQRKVIVPEENPIQLQCPAAGRPQPYIRWFRDSVFLDAILTASNSDEIVSVPENWTLTILDARPRMSGNYTCVIGNRYGKLRWTFVVLIIRRVPSPPIIRRKPESQTAVEGSNLFLECRVLSDLPFEIKWLKHYKVNGSFIDKKGKPHLTVLKNRNITEYGDMWGQTLNLNDVRVRDTGWYTCLVNNLFGSSHSSAWVEVISLREARSRSQTSAASSLLLSALKLQNHTHLVLVLLLFMFILSSS